MKTVMGSLIVIDETTSPKSNFLTANSLEKKICRTHFVSEIMSAHNLVMAAVGSFMSTLPSPAVAVAAAVVRGAWYVLGSYLLCKRRHCTTVAMEDGDNADLRRRRPIVVTCNIMCVVYSNGGARDRVIHAEGSPQVEVPAWRVEVEGGGSRHKMVSRGGRAAWMRR